MSGSGKPMGNRMNRSLPKVLVCQPDEGLARGIRDHLGEEGYGVRVVREGIAAWRAIEDGSVNVVVTEAELDGLTGLDLLERVGRSDIAVPIIVLSAHDNAHVAAKALNLGACQLVVKDPGSNLYADIVETLARSWPPPRSSLEQQLSRENGDLLSKLQEQRRQLGQLAHRTAALERDAQERKGLDYLKTDFITLLSHEMRTPLTSIMGFAEVLAQGLYEDPDELLEILGYINASGTRLKEFVNDALELFQWYSGMITLDISQVEVETWVQVCMQRIEHKAAENGISFSRNQSRETCIEADADALDCALHRVLDNAIKFTRPGGSVVVETHDSSDGVRVDIIDDGIGIDPTEVDSLFRPLEVCDLTHHSEGKGLSLALVHAAVRNHGGEVEIISEGVGKGTRVSLSLPTRIPEDRRLRCIVAEPMPRHMLLTQLES